MRKAVIVGLGAFLILCALALWLAGSLGLLPGYAQLRAYTDDASGLTDGTKVRLEGIPVGYLDHQRLTGSSDPLRRVEFDMKVKSGYLSKIPVDSAVGVVADNLMGDQSINITRGQSPQHVEPGAELHSVKAVDPSKVMAQIANEMQALQTVSDRVTALLAGVDAGRGSIGKLQHQLAEAIWRASGRGAETDRRLSQCARHGKQGTDRQRRVVQPGRNDAETDGRHTGRTPARAGDGGEARSAGPGHRSDDAGSRPPENGCHHADA